MFSFSKIQNHIKCFSSADIKIKKKKKRNSGISPPANQLTVAIMLVSLNPYLKISVFFLKQNTLFYSLK